MTPLVWFSVGAFLFAALIRVAPSKDDKTSDDVCFAMCIGGVLLGLLIQCAIWTVKP